MARTYPERLAARSPSKGTIRRVRQLGAKAVAEVGIYQGATTLGLAEAVGTDGWLYLFDFQSNIDAVSKLLHKKGFSRFTGFGNSPKLLDSYCWSLMRLLQRKREPFLDYVYLDGAHTWCVDGFAFLLIDELLKPGGHVEFDDYDWTLEKSPSLNPRKFPLTGRVYTREQVRTKQVALIVEILAARRGYEAVVSKRLYRKPKADVPSVG